MNQVIQNKTHFLKRRIQNTFCVTPQFSWIDSATVSSQLLMSSVWIPQGDCSTIHCLELTLSESFFLCKSLFYVLENLPARLFLCKSDPFICASILLFFNSGNRECHMPVKMPALTFQLNPEAMRMTQQLTFLGPYTLSQNDQNMFN